MLCPHRFESMQTIDRKRERKNTPGRFLIFYFIPFYFIQYVCLSTMQFLPHSLHCHTNHEPLLLCVCLSVCGYMCVAFLWVSVMSRRCTSIHTIPVQFPYCFFSPHSSSVKCKKNRYPLIDSKAVKILPSSKGCVSFVRSVEPVAAFLKQKD